MRDAPVARYGNVLLEFAGAVRAARSLDIDLALAVRALLGGGGCRSLGLLSDVLRLVERFNDKEQNKRHQQEVDHCGNEISVGERCGVFLAAESDSPMGEIDSAGDRTEDRHNDVIDEGIHDALECAADDNTDCQIENIALADELFELFDKFFHDPFFLSLWMVLL